MYQLGALLEQVGKVWRSSKRQMCIQAARSQQEVQTLTQMVVEVADRGRGVVGVVVHVCDVVPDSVYKW